MFHALVGIAAAIFIWKTFQEWRQRRAVRRMLAPGAGLTRGIKRPVPEWLAFTGALVFAFAAMTIVGMVIENHEKKPQGPVAQAGDPCATSSDRTTCFFEQGSKNESPFDIYAREHAK